MPLYVASNHVTLDVCTYMVVVVCWCIINTQIMSSFIKNWKLICPLIVLGMKMYINCNNNCAVYVCCQKNIYSFICCTHVYSNLCDNCFRMYLFSAWYLICIAMFRMFWWVSRSVHVLSCHFIHSYRHKYFLWPIFEV